MDGTLKTLREIRDYLGVCPSILDTYINQGLPVFTIDGYRRTWALVAAVNEWRRRHLVKLEPDDDCFRGIVQIAAYLGRSAKIVRTYITSETLRVEKVNKPHKYEATKAVLDRFIQDRPDEAANFAPELPIFDPRVDVRGVVAIGDYLGLCECTTRELIRYGRLPVENVWRGHIWATKTALDKWLDDFKTGGRVKLLSGIARESSRPFYSCFISYSSHDQTFAERLHTDLRAKNLHCWFAPEDLKTGDRFQETIEKSIGVFDKVMIVLSRASVKSLWVEREINAAREREDRENCAVLFPIRIDDTVMRAPQPWAADIRRSRQIGDFRDWRQPGPYRTALERLLRDLTARA